MIFLFLIAVLIIFLLDGVPLLKKRLWKELYTVAFLISFAIYLGVSKMLNLTNPIVWLDKLLRPIGEVIF